MRCYCPLFMEGGKDMSLPIYTSLYLTAVVFVLLLFQLELGFRGKCKGKIGETCYQPSKRKSWKTGLLTPPKETAAARAVRLVPRVGYCKQGQVQFHPLASCNTSSMNIKRHPIWCLRMGSGGTLCFLTGSRICLLLAFCIDRDYR